MISLALVICGGVSGAKTTKINDFHVSKQSEWYGSAKRRTHLSAPPRQPILGYCRLSSPQFKKDISSTHLWLVRPSFPRIRVLLLAIDIMQSA